MTAGEQLRVIRHTRGLSQREIANCLGVTPQSVSLLETNKRDIDINTAIKLSNFLDVPLKYFCSDLSDEEMKLIDETSTCEADCRDGNSLSEKALKEVVARQAAEIKYYKNMLSLIRGILSTEVQKGDNHDQH